jgi:hypothetical protein
VSQPTAAVRKLGERLLERELEHAAHGQEDAAALAAAADQATRKLGHLLSRLIGVEGYQGLLRRALHLARIEWPVLQGVQAAVDPNGVLDGLDEAVQGVDPAQARDALGAVLAQLVWLLVTLIGVDLALRTVREGWPEIQLTGEAAAAEDTTT